MNVNSTFKSIIVNETIETFSLNFGQKVSTLLNSIDLLESGCHSENITLEGGIPMINEGDFKETVEELLNNPDAYTKEEIYTAFLEMTERYLNEMITSTNLEKAITAGMGRAKADELLEEIATSNPCVTDLDMTNAQEPDLKEIVRNLLAFTEFELGCCSLGGDNDSPEDEI